MEDGRVLRRVGVSRDFGTSRNIGTGNAGLLPNFSEEKDRGLDLLSPKGEVNRDPPHAGRGLGEGSVARSGRTMLCSAAPRGDLPLFPQGGTSLLALRV
jgi:hypothetical protein